MQKETVKEIAEKDYLLTEAIPLWAGDRAQLRKVVNRKNDLVAFIVEFCQ